MFLQAENTKHERCNLSYFLPSIGMDSNRPATRSENFNVWMKINGLNPPRVETVSGVHRNTIYSFIGKPNAELSGGNESDIANSFGVSPNDIFAAPKRLLKLPPQIATDKRAMKAWEAAEHDPDRWEAIEPTFSFDETDKLDYLPTSVPQDGMVLIPSYDVKLAAGGGYHIENQDAGMPWNLPRKFITSELGADPECLSVAEVIGVSMTPTLQPRDRVLIDHSDRNPTPPGIFALWDGDGLLIKNVQRVHKSEPARILITSDNPSYPPQEVFIEDITIIGRVVWFSRRM